MENLKQEIRKEITILFEHILDLVQVAVPEGNWKAIRSKILKKSNDTIRSIDRYIDDKMEEIPPDEYERIKK